MDSRRRKSDGGSGVARLEDSTPDAADAVASGWVQSCVTRLVALEPQLTVEEAMQIADCIRGFERTGAMDPVAAADFVSAEMQKAQRTRFERRAGAAQAKPDPLSKNFDA